MSLNPGSRSDQRVEYIRKVVLDSFNIKIGAVSASISENSEVLEFLGNLYCQTLTATVWNENGAVAVKFSTKISRTSMKDSNGVMISGVRFVKRNTEPLTKENITNNILFSTFGQTQKTLQNMCLTDNIVDNFSNDGYVIIKNVFDTTPTVSASESNIKCNDIDDLIELMRYIQNLIAKKMK